MPQLRTIAKWINQTMPGYSATVIRGYCNTDRKMAGTRLRRPGKGREGTRIIVIKAGITVLDHNAAETYRCNQEVFDWYEKEKMKIMIWKGK